MELKTFIDVDLFAREVQDELTDITEAMRTQTARTAYYGMQHKSAKRQADTVSLTAKTVEAKLTSNYRKSLEEAAREEVEGTNKSPTRVTAEMVKSAVMTDPNYLKYAKLQIEADEIEGISRVAYDAFKTRRDMLVSMGHLKTAELKGNMVIQGARQAAEGYGQRRAARDPNYQPSASNA